jgi:hypothetical protein
VALRENRGYDEAERQTNDEVLKWPMARTVSWAATSEKSGIESGARERNEVFLVNASWTLGLIGAL